MKNQAAETEMLDAPRAEPDFEAADEMAEWAVENADMLSRLGEVL